VDKVRLELEFTKHFSLSWPSYVSAALPHGGLDSVCSKVK